MKKKLDKTANLFEDAIDNITKNISNRLNNKFIFSFLISWIVFNFKAIAYFTFANVPISDKLKTVSTDYLIEYWYWGAPLIFALFYVIIFPYIQNYFDTSTDKATNDKVRYQNIKEIQKLENQKKQVKLRVEITEAQTEFSSINEMGRKIEEQTLLIENLQKSSKDLNNLNTELLGHIKNLEKFIQPIDLTDITDEERERLRNEYIKFCQTEEYAPFIQVATLISKGESLSSIEHLIVERFKFMNLIKIKDIEDGERNKIFDFTKTGYSFWTEYVKDIKLKTLYYESKKVSKNERLSDFYLETNNEIELLIDSKKYLEILSPTELVEVYNKMSDEYKSIKDDFGTEHNIYSSVSRFCDYNPKGFIEIVHSVIPESKRLR